VRYQPTISAVTINYAGFEDSRGCVRSLQKAYNFEHIVIVDNPANQNDYRLKALEGPGTHIIYNERNNGFGAANNTGIKWILKHTDSNYVLVINNDTTVDEKCIDHLLEEDEEDVGILTAKILFEHDRQTIWYAGGAMDWKRGAPRVFHTKCNNNELNDHSRYVAFASGCTMLIKREVLDAIGGFDERYFMYDEDVDYGLRARKAGYKIKYVASSIVYHKVNASLGRKSKVGIFHPDHPNLLFFVKHRVQNRIMNVIAHAKGMEKLKFWLFFGAMSIVKNAHFILRGHFKAVKTYLDAIYNGIVKGRDKKRSSGEEYKL